MCSSQKAEQLIQARVDRKSRSDDNVCVQTVAPVRFGVFEDRFMNFLLCPKGKGPDPIMGHDTIAAEVHYWIRALIHPEQ